MNKINRFMWGFVAVAAMGLASCSEEPDCPGGDLATGSGLFIINQGNFGYSNSSLSFYDPETNEASENVFYDANDMRLGDVAQSMTIHGGKGWVVVNGSSVIFAINPDTFKEEGRIENIGSPRYMLFVNDEKAYVSQLNDNRIYIVNPKTYSITGYITVPGMEASTGSTEQMVKRGKYVYATCWSYQKSIIKIDTENDRVVDNVEVGIQPQSLVVDNHGDLWTICDGGWDGNPVGYEAPSLWKVDADNFEVEHVYNFTIGEFPSSLQINGRGDTLYWLNGTVWSMNVESEQLPSSPLIQSQSFFYALTVNPVNGEIYAADAIDYVQKGKIYRYSATGTELDSFYAGVIPGGFCWK